MLIVSFLLPTFDSSCFDLPVQFHVGILGTKTFTFPHSFVININQIRNDEWRQVEFYNAFLLSLFHYIVSSCFHRFLSDLLFAHKLKHKNDCIRINENEITTITASINNKIKINFFLWCLCCSFIWPAKSKSWPNDNGVLAFSSWYLGDSVTSTLRCVRFPAKQCENISLPWVGYEHMNGCGNEFFLFVFGVGGWGL